MRIYEQNNGRLFLRHGDDAAGKGQDTDAFSGEIDLFDQRIEVVSCLDSHRPHHFRVEFGEGVDVGSLVELLDGQIEDIAADCEIRPQGFI